jgi:hypothetical protein
MRKRGAGLVVLVRRRYEALCSATFPTDRPPQRRALFLSREFWFGVTTTLIGLSLIIGLISG